MRIGIVTDCVNSKAGGLYYSVSSQARALCAGGETVDLHSIDEGQDDELRQHWSPVDLTLSPSRGPRALGYAPGMPAKLIAGNYQILHTHGIWQGASLAVLQWHRKSRRPFLISPRGMLDPWALQHSSWKKKLAGWAFENDHLRRAACLNALAVSELGSMRKYGLKNPVAVIPNGVELPGNLKTEKQTSERKVLLFLGRLHPKKGLVNALRAWAEIGGRSEWQFVIAGWDQGGHQAELERLCDELGVSVASVAADQYLANPEENEGISVVFVGPAFGAQKDELLRRASAFILPSFSEGLPMSVLEAWAYRLPVVMTDHCNVPEGFAAEAAIRIGTDVESIRAGLSELFQAREEGLQTIGMNGLNLVERQFTWPQVAAQMKEVYEWVLGGGSLPSCVEIQ